MDFCQNVICYDLFSNHLLSTPKVSKVDASDLQSTDTHHKHPTSTSSKLEQVVNHIHKQVELDALVGQLVQQQDYSLCSFLQLVDPEADLQTQLAGKVASIF